MNRRFFLGLIAAAAMPATAMAETLSLRAISNYLNSFTTGIADFTQINSDGTISTGTIYIKRPGRIRFEYNPPEAALVMAGGGSVAVFDPKSNEGPQRYPLSETPLKIILEHNVDLARTNMVTRHVSDGTRTTVTAQDPEHPEYGNIQMVYTANPTQLRQWIVTDNAGDQTTVILGDLTIGTAINDIKFNILAETAARGG